MKKISKSQQLSIIRLTALIYALIFFINSFVWVFEGDTDKWFSRFSMSMIMFIGWGIMKHLSKTNIDKDEVE